MKTRNEILTSVLNKMPDVFSTNDFCIRLRDEGFAEKDINDHVHLKFINKHCQNVLDSKRIYIKTKGNDNAAKEYKEQLTEIADVALDMMRDSFTVHEIIKEMKSDSDFDDKLILSLNYLYRYGFVKKIKKHYWLINVNKINK